ncbi:hypothetical protein DFQ27_001294 [Actinomortierella ambigua]|uniref:Uncharacterized protein n=1 Tax=Actinomortierella ambigua TaxID=1343610 RepID=A0A9P6PL04_9FUNG|nr:hypothetical protein DFQ27_001294 [Actinomortierella ambigua]
MPNITNEKRPREDDSTASHSNSKRRRDNRHETMTAATSKSTISSKIRLPQDTQLQHRNFHITSQSPNNGYYRAPARDHDDHNNYNAYIRDDRYRSSYHRRARSPVQWTKDRHGVPQANTARTQANTPTLGRRARRS